MSDMTFPKHCIAAEFRKRATARAVELTTGAAASEYDGPRDPMVGVEATVTDAARNSMCDGTAAQHRKPAEVLQGMRRRSSPRNRCTGSRMMLRILHLSIFAAVVAVAASFAPRGRPQGASSAEAAPGTAGAAPSPLAAGRGFKSPYACAMSPDGKRLYVTFSTAAALGVIDTTARKLVAEIPVGGSPHGVAVSADGSTAYVTLHDEAALAVVDLQSQSVRRVSVGAFPEHVTLDARGGRAWVGLLCAGEVVELDLKSLAIARRFTVDAGVRQIVQTPDHARIAVVCDSHPVHGRPGRDPGANRPEARSVWVVDLEKGSTLRKIAPDASNARGAIVTPDGAYAIVAHQRPKSDRVVPGVTRDGKAFVEPASLATGRLFTNGITLVSLDEVGEPLTVLIDGPDRFWPDPCDIRWCQGGKTIAVVSSGGNAVLLLDAAKVLAAAQDDTGGAYVNWALWKGDSGYDGDEGLDASAAYVRARVSTPANPRWTAVAPDGETLWCCCTLDDSLAVIDIAKGTSTRVPVGNAAADIVRIGERIFHDAAYCGSRAFTCASCHPDGGTDGLNWRLTGDRRDALNTKSLLGIDGTAPYGWHAKSETLTDRATSTFRRTMGFDVTPADADAVAAYVATLRHTANPHSVDGKLSAAAVRGRALFQGKAGCAECHTGPRFTNGFKRDVGTGGSYDVPSLIGVWRTAPYLHTGKASNLADIWDRGNPEGRHGKTGDLTPAELADVIEFVKSL